MSPHEPLGHKFSSQKDPNAQHTKKSMLAQEMSLSFSFFKHGWHSVQEFFFKPILNQIYTI